MVYVISKIHGNIWNKEKLCPTNRRRENPVRQCRKTKYKLVIATFKFLNRTSYNDILLNSKRHSIQYGCI